MCTQRLHVGLQCVLMIPWCCHSLIYSTIWPHGPFSVYVRACSWLLYLYIHMYAGILRSFVVVFLGGVYWFLAGDDRMLPKKEVHCNGRSLGKY